MNELATTYYQCGAMFKTDKMDKMEKLAGTVDGLELQVEAAAVCC
jgi:hypothetical protein